MSIIQEKLDFKEAVSLFLERTMTDLKSGAEIPPLNIVFPESAFALFKYVQSPPYKRQGVIIPDLYDRDIEKAKIENNSNPNLPAIIVHNPVKFFELLTDITNAWRDKKTNIGVVINQELYLFKI